MNYLKYIEHAAENLQFFLWFQDYSARWESLPASEKALAPEWTPTQAAIDATTGQGRAKRMDPKVAAVLKNIDFADASSRGSEKNDPFGTPSQDDRTDYMSEYSSSTDDNRTMNSGAMHSMLADQAFDSAGMKWKPCRFLVQ